MQTIKYTDEWKSRWNDFIKSSNNGTFLLDRDFMEYHKDRFSDCSLIFEEGDDILGVLPANWNEKDNTVYSHQGLTYGGLVLSPYVTTVQVMQMVDEMIEYYHDTYKAGKIVYKPVPYIYQQTPNEEDLFAIYKHSAQLTERELSSSILLAKPLKMRNLRRRMIHKAVNNDLYVSKSSDIEEYWYILSDVLMKRHNVHPVHSISELHLLMDRFPQNIKLYVTKNSDNKIIAGTLLFITDMVIHSQYIASSEEGREKGALDMLFNYLIKENNGTHKYFDFGISSIEGGNILNEGLIFQKEGFGGRGVCYDKYVININ